MKVDRIRDAEDHITVEAVQRSATRVLPAGCLLVVTRSGILSRTLPVAINEVPVALNQDLKALAPNGAASIDFIRYFLRCDERGLLERCVKDGTTVASVNLDTLLAQEMPLPPIDEQRRIVEKLDAVFEKSRAAKARLERLPALLDQLKRSILAAAFRGDLTKDWRAANPDVEPASVLLERIRAERRRKCEEALRAKGKDPKKATYEEPAAVDTSELAELPAGWVWASIDELSSLQQYGSSAKTADGGEVPVVRMGNIVDGELVLENLKFLPANHDEFPDLHLVSGDLLFNRTNSPELVGKTAVYAGELSPCSFASYLIRLRFACVEPRWVSHFINSPYGRDWVGSVVAQQVGQANVNGSKLRALAVPVPPTREMFAALRVMDASFEAVRSLRKRVEHSAACADKGEQAALAKAFRGELVPQDPTDEPADVLLERLRTVRAAEPDTRRTRTTRPAATAPTPATMTALAGAPVDRIIAALRASRRQSTSAIADATGLDAADVRAVLKSLERLGKVAVEGKARATTYVWQGDS